jgi:hypothetical protein
VHEARQSVGGCLDVGEGNVVRAGVVVDLGHAGEYRTPSAPLGSFPMRPVNGWAERAVTVSRDCETYDAGVICVFAQTAIS